MRRLFISLLLIAAGCHSAVAGERTFEFVPAEGQKLVYSNGAQVLLIGGNKSAMAVAISENDGSRTWLDFSIDNRAEEQITVFDTLLTATSGDKSLEVYNFADLAKEQKRAAGWRAFGAAMAGVANSYNASQAGYSTTSASVYGGGSSAHGSATTYNQGAVVAAQNAATDRNDRMMSNLQQQTAAARSQLANRALRTNTIDPGHNVVGGLMIDLPKKNKKQPPTVNLSVKVGDEVFGFQIIEKYD
jgi:hypothetical protein